MITDITDFQPYKARFIRAEDSERPQELLAQVVVELLEARQQGKQREFLINFAIQYGRQTPDSAPRWVDNFSIANTLQDVLEDIIFPFWWRRYEDTMYECEACGRLHIETDDGSLVSYLPEDSERGILQSRHHHPPYPDK